MTKLSFETLSFQLRNENDPEKETELQVNLLRIFTTKIPVKELELIGPFKLIDEHTVEFIDTYQHKAELKFSFILNKYFDQLINTINGNKAVYIHRNSQIPLIGNVSFGIVYRNSSLIEIKPITSCNLNCIYCSVGEGQSSNKVDFVVEKDYLVEELQKLIEFVNEPVEVHIGVQGEPFLYADLIPLIEDLHQNKQITIVSMDTNFTLVTKSQLDHLAKFDKLRFNVSLDSMDPKIAEKLAGCPYKLDYVLKMIQYAVDKGIKILIAPVYIPGHNNEELEKIVEFVKKLGVKAQAKHPLLGIQNFLNYKTGRNPVKANNWQEFYEMIKTLEQKTGLKQKLSAEDFGIRKTKNLPKPFKLGDTTRAMIKAPDRFKDTCLAVSKERVISVQNCQFKKGKKIRVKIGRDKHNIFSGKMI